MVIKVVGTVQVLYSSFHSSKMRHKKACTVNYEILTESKVLEHKRRMWAASDEL